MFFYNYFIVMTLVRKRFFLDKLVNSQSLDQKFVRKLGNIFDC